MKQGKRIRNLKLSSLVASQYLENPEQWEWRNIPPSLDDEDLDVGSLSNLWIKCSLCGMSISSPCSGFLICPDCGAEYFRVRCLVQRTVMSISPLGYRMSGTKGNYFLHVTLPENIVAGVLRYTINGGMPNIHDKIYRHPIHITDKTQEVRLRYFTQDDAQSQVFYRRAALTCSCGYEVALQEGSRCECPQCHAVYQQSQDNFEWICVKSSQLPPPLPKPPPLPAAEKPARVPSEVFFDAVYNDEWGKIREYLRAGVSYADKKLALNMARSETALILIKKYMYYTP